MTADGSVELDVAIVGLAGRFPSAPGVSEFWRLLVENRIALTRFDREELLAAGVPAAHVDDPDYVRAAPVLDDAARFDAALFGYSPREAERIDPQQRHLLELAWAALDDAGIDPARETGRIGVFAGSALNSYLLNSRLSTEFFDDYLPNLLGGDKDFLATRIAYKLGLRGPALTVQTACSTSLVALHLASQSLLSGESDVALVGAMAVRTPLAVGHLYENGSVFSPDGACRPFDAEAAGTVFGSGGACIVLRRLEDAREHRHTIRALLKGSAINNDGDSKSDFTAPSIEMQSEAIADALAAADVSAQSIDYVEAHGTGTYLGDPIEIAALSRAFALDDVEPGSCGVGSVKSNIGHLDAAAGLASLVKVTLALENELLPASANFTTPNPQIGMDSTPFRVVQSNRAWPRGARVRRAGVSSLGMGGTNAHVILEEAPAQVADERQPAGEVVLPLSARTTSALDRMVTDLTSHAAAERPHTADVAFTLQRGRRQLAHRTALVVGGTGESLEDPWGAPSARVRVRPTARAMQRDVGFLFPGQGSQYPGMARALLDAEPAFSAAFERSRAIVLDAAGFDLREILYARDDARLHETDVTQPALFSIEYAYAELLQAWGLTPNLLLGHSIGEFAAAVVAGVMDHETGARLVVERGRLMQAAPRGQMLAVPLPETTVRGMLPADLDICVLNAADGCVVGGPSDAIERFAARLEDDDVSASVLRTSHAFHTRSMAAAAEAFEAVVRSVSLAPPGLPLLCNVTGRFMDAADAVDPKRWANQIRQPVRFDDCLRTLFSGTPTVLVEVGPGVTLGQLAGMHEARPDTFTAVSAGRHPKNAISDRAAALAALAGCWTNGVTVDWSLSHRHADARRVPLPSYPFEGERHWLAPRSGAAPASVDRALEPGPQTLWQPTARLIGRRLGRPEAERAGSRAHVLLADADLEWAWQADDTLAAFARADLPMRAATDSRSLASAIGELPSASRRDVTVVWPLGRADADDPTAMLERCLSLVQAIGALDCASLELHLVSRGCSGVLDAPVLSATPAALFAACRAAARELDALHVAWIDLEERSVHGVDDYLEARDVLDSETRVQSVAKRDARWWVPTFERVCSVASFVARPAADPARTTGWQLVIGGSGGVGTRLVSHLRAAGTGVVVSSRSGGDAADRVRLDPASASFDADFAALVRDRGGAPDRVHLLAGHVADGTVLTKSAEVLASVLEPKLGGSERVLAACVEHAVDTLVLFSSVGALEGPAGQFDYAAANAYQLALASRAPASTRVLAVAWPGWAGTGMLQRIADRTRRERAERLAIDVDAALRTLDGLLDGDAAGTVVVSAVDPARLGDVADGDAEDAPATTAGVDGSGSSEPASAADIVRRAWAEALGVDDLDDDADFYALGGNSLALTQIVSRLRKRDGLSLPVAEALSAPRLAAWIELLGQLDRAEPDLIGEPEPIAATPTSTRAAVPHYGIQRFAARRGGALSARWNLASLLVMARSVTLDELERAVARVAARHDALRAVVDDAGRLVFHDVAAASSVEHVDLSAIDGSGWSSALADVLESAHSRFDLGRGPLFRALLIEGGDAREQRVFVVAHHFVVDGLSWSILLSDLQAALQSVLGFGDGLDEHVTLGYRDWAIAMLERANSDAYAAKVPHWTDMPEADRCFKLASNGGDNRNSAARSVSLLLDESRSSLLQDIGAGGVAIEDVCLVALGRAITDGASAPVLIDVLGLGRELSDEIDVSRTIGYFNSYAPVLLGDADAESLETTLARVSAARARGAEHDLLRYLTPDDTMQRRMARVPESRILFNFIGSLKESNAGLLDPELWRESDEPTGSLHDPDALRDHEMAFRAEFDAGRLRLTLVYGADVHDERTVTSLLERFESELVQLAEQLESQR